MNNLCKKLRVCLISIDYPPNIIGGTGVYTKNLAENLSKKGHRVTVVTTAENDRYNNDIKQKKKIEFVYFKKKNIFFFWWFCFSFFKKNRHLFDIVHGNDLFHFPIIFLKRDYKIISTVHNSYLQRFCHYNFLRKLYYPILMLAEQILLLRSDKIIAVSDLCEKYLDKYLFIKNKIVVIPNGVDIKQFARKDSKYIKSKFSLRGEDKIILFVGRLVENKNPLFLCDLAKKFFPEKWKLVIVGDGPQKKEVKKFAKSKKIIFINKIDFKEMPRVYNGSDLLLLPSKSEGLSLTVLESLACQLPAIVTPESNYRDLIENGINGFVLKTTDSPQEWLKKIRKILKQKKEYGKRSRKKIMDMRLTTENFVDKHERLYLNLLK